MYDLMEIKELPIWTSTVADRDGNTFLIFKYYIGELGGNKEL
jgi:hypothetical protein